MLKVIQGLLVYVNCHVLIKFTQIPIEISRIKWKETTETKETHKLQLLKANLNRLTWLSIIQGKRSAIQANWSAL